MGAGNKRKKFHDKDKYYHLAKEQGLRSRAAFKLTQINRKYPCLEQCSTAVLDLCAAPGGWTQIAARTCPKSAHIVAVDILPIRSFKGFPNITTLIGDITTDKCKAEIKQAILQGPAAAGGMGGSKKQQVDLVLHDGAPNIGAEFGKDAYEQNELAVHALRCATQHLRPGGTFITKIYRSRDYASYHWLLQQFFDNVAVFKPKASRQQSAEIFLVGQHYKAPLKIDPRLLDPKHIFEAVEGNTTGGGDKESTAGAGAAASAKMSVFHKNYDKPKRQRSGYDMNFFDGTMRHLTPVKDFVTAGLKDAIQILGQSTGMEFYCAHCADARRRQQSSSSSSAPQDCTTCSFLLHHPLTTSEIQTNVSDLQVLNKGDFKALLNWRTKMQEALEQRQEDGRDSDDDDDEGDSDAGEEDEGDDDDDNSDAEEEQIQTEISEMRQRRMRERKKKKKKERAVASKRRRQAALGMDLNAIDVPDQEKLFSLASITNRADLALASEVNLDQVTDDQVGGFDQDDDIVIGEEERVTEDEAERHRRRERDLEEAYEMYLQSTKNGAVKNGSRLQKRSKKLQRQKVLEEATEDQEMMLAAKSGIRQDTLAYAKLLHGPRGSDDDDDDDSDSSDDDEDDGFHAEPVTAEVHAEIQQQRKQQREASAVAVGNPLIPKFDEEPSSVKAARWFSNPLFETIQKAAETAATSQKNDHDDNDMDSEEESDNDSDNQNDDDDKSESDDESTSSGRKGKPSPETTTSKKRKTSGVTAEDVLASMPMTDKQKRHVKRLKQIALDERKEARRAQRMDENQRDFEIAPAEGGGKGGNDDSSDDGEDDQLKHLSPSKRKQVLEAREKIKAGMGKVLEEDSMKTDGNGKSTTASSSFEVVGVEDDEKLSALGKKDDRRYDSENEDYDSDDYAETLALGTMLLRKSKEKAFLDASYNRYAWNDPSEVPDWFIDDEKKNYRPQLPIPPALLAKMKEKMMALATKPIQKVAEARARKNKRAKAKLEVAKKKAEAVAKSSEMSDSMKLKAISKALRGQENRKPGKTYVVAKKGRGGNAPGKGVKLVDKRQKSDKRAADRLDKKRKKGKQNGLTGSKRRRHHK